MKKKVKFKQVFSGIIAAITILTSVLPAGMVYAEENSEVPKYEEVKDQLEIDEVVTAKDIEIAFGTAFDLEKDFKGIDIPDESKVKVTFHEAKAEDGRDFSTENADSYKAVYHVEPVSGNTVYQISRKITVLEPVIEITEVVQQEVQTETHSVEEISTEILLPETEIQTEEFIVESEDDETEVEPVTEPATEISTEISMDNEEELETGNIIPELSLELPYIIENPMEGTSENETEIEKEIFVEEILMEEVDTALATEQSETQESETEGVDEDPVPDKFKLVNNHVFCAVPDKYAVNPNANNAATSLRTVVFYDEDGSTVKRAAYCLQPNVSSPPNGTYDKDSKQVEILETGSKEKNVAKCLYYMYGGPAWGKTIDYADGSGSVNMKSKLENYGCSGKKNFTAVTHYVLSYLYLGAGGKWNANTGDSPVMNSEGVSMIKTLAGYIKKLPNPTTELSETTITTTYHEEINRNVSKTVTYKSIDENVATILLPDGIILVNETTGISSTGSVSISGGTKFHLEASTDISGIGSYILNCKYPVDFTAFALKTSGKQDIGFSYYSGDKALNLMVEWTSIAKIEIIKSDARTGETLAGAVYGIYSDSACTNLIMQMPPTDKHGVSGTEMAKTQDTVYLKEISAPSGYVRNSTVYFINPSVNEMVTQNVTDNEQLGNLTIYKEGEEFTSAVTNEDGVVFQYEKSRQKGAVYDVFAAEDIKTPTGNIVYEAGTLIEENLVTDENGSVILKNLHLGTYNVIEVQAPENFCNKKESKKVVLSYGGQTKEVVFAETDFINERQKAKVTVLKKDKDTQNMLAGGVFGLYADEDVKNADGAVVIRKGTLIEKVTTGNENPSVFTADIPIGYRYTVKEIQAPPGYLRNTEDVYTFRFDYTNDKEAAVTFEHIFTNARVNAAINLQKKDAETNSLNPQGDASLENAVYGLYARKDIIHPDGMSGIVYKKDEQVGTLITDKEGKARIENLYLGEYFIKEISSSNGYLKDEQEYDLVCNYEGDMTATVEKKCVSMEPVKKQPFQIIKAANNGKTDADLLNGVGFQAYLVSLLAKKKDGSYDFEHAEPMIIGENGATEIFTDEKGYTVSVPLPYGTYIVKETTTPHNYDPVEDFIVRITEHKPNQPQTWRVLLDDEFEAKLKITKKDDETKKTVLAAGTEFKVYDLENEKYVEQVTTYPTTMTHKSYFTDADGYLILPQNLKIGRYRIEEVTAPEGYTVNNNHVEILVDANTLYQMDYVSGDAIIEVVYENHPVKGQLTVAKKGEILENYRKDFEYGVQNLAGAVFEVYAAEDIYSADFQKDEFGNRIVQYAQDVLVAVITTGEDGQAVLSDLPLGKYKVLEKNASDGFVHCEETQYVDFEYMDQDTPVISSSVIFENERQKVEISVIKKDLENGNALAGAEFTLYTKDAIKVGDKVIVKPNTMLASAVSGKDGKATFTQDLPFGSYYVKETKCPSGFVSSNEIIEFTAFYQGQDVEIVRLEEVFENKPTVTEFTKSDLTTCVELDGATLTVFDKEGNVIETWISVKEEPHVIKRLHAGETYILREEIAPYGYLRAEDVEFTVRDTEQIQKVEMKDAVPTGRITINKHGEFVEKVTWNDMVASAVENIFGYVTGSIQGVTFEVYALEDIKSADGLSSAHYKKDDLVATITTDTLGYAKVEGLPLGKYYIVEKETADGFVLDGEPREIDLTYRDQNTSVVTYDEDWQNNRQKAKVTVLKREKNSERVLQGAVFSLCAKEDIKSTNGSIIMKADTLIEQKATDANGKLLFTADLPVGGRFYVKEVQASPGFVTADEIKEFVFEYVGAEQEEVVFDFTFDNEPTIFEFTKADLVNGGEIEGAKLQVTDEAGNVMDEWISGTVPHVIKELTVGKTYTLTECIPANGYVTAESIAFTVENTTEIQRVDMKDDVTKVQISKTDMTDGGSEVEGAKLYILDNEDRVMDSWISGKEPHYIERLPIGKYTLLEESAPLGYIISERVPFEVKDTGEIQKVQMIDDTARGKIILNKTDQESGEPMKGVEFILCNNEGKVLETMVTDSAGHAESKLYPIATFKSGKYEEAIGYVLKETKTLNGYVWDKTAHEVKFSYVDDKTPVVECMFELTNKKEPVNEAPEKAGVTYADVPKTGDETKIVIFVVVMVLAAGCLVSLLLLRKKNS